MSEGQELRELFRKGIPARIEALQAAMAGCATGNPEAPSSLRRIAHTLAGAGGTFGYPDITEAGRLAERAADEHLLLYAEYAVSLLRYHYSLGAEKPQEILIIEDDEDVRNLLAGKFQAAGFAVHAAGTFHEAESVLYYHPVAAIILDLVLPDSDGRNLLVKIRENLSTATTPVLVLSSMTNINAKTECLALGANDFIEKPFNPDWVVAMVTTRLEETAKSERDAGRDELTGILNRAAFRDSYLKAAASAARKNERLALAIFDLDHFKSVNDTYGHNTGDDVLRRTARVMTEALRKSDVFGRWGGEEFIVLFPDTTADGAAMAMEKALERFRGEKFSPEGRAEFNVSFSCGVCDAEPAKSLEDNVAEADRLLYAAKESGRNRVVKPTDSTAPSAGQVFIAEDDDLTASILKHRLARDGLEIIHFVNGLDALEAARNLKPNLAILDINMPGLDGFSLLEALRKMPAWREVPILILSSLTNESDIVKGFDLGADDYVAKPFSPNEMVARVRRHLRKKKR